MVGTVSRTARVSVARRNLKEAVSKSAAPTNRNRIEAATSGREGQKTQSPIPSGRWGSRFGGYMR